MLFAFLTTLVLLIATTVGAPTTLDPNPDVLATLNSKTSTSSSRLLVPAPNTQNCLAAKHGVGNTVRVCYTITIGAIFDDGKGCDGVHDHVDSGTDGRLNHYTWECTGESGDGNEDYTRLYFCLLGSKDVSGMNEELEGNFAVA
ncbi:hypothetical protein CLAFUW4_02297 [Fulvia fulva]|uniref:Uncharacterized protein n=1 Tax=Passalora fulva TaxID=5499 RepID=A0A9Q8P4B4_PASFU|nr:uncharacterized protein CLAFUR5_02286 [Fulvia fulva]KAK4635261.1 hypothetical protein CLAFUR4_02292 [Fulvia fulva]UJO12674.1 hypothetical protein CLAFUR5_02286 [Fulvia fulva]WPV09184.1 hypothetical protein CLAFUW4_02297 [Fulvia fulva]WPV23380.1 hypothetical protein CLAFUW7_02297 [Fulvia fulva]